MPWSRWPILDRVLCNLIDGTAVDGVLIDRRGPLLVLADAQLFTPSGEPTQMDGTVYIERSQVLFLQARQPKGG